MSANTKRGYKRKNKNHYKCSLFHCFSSNMYCTPLMLWCSTNKISVFLEFWITQTHKPDPRCDHPKDTSNHMSARAWMHAHTAVCHDVRKFHVMNCGEVLRKLSHVWTTGRAAFRHGQVITCINVHCTRYSNPIMGLDRPWGLQEGEAPRFQDSWHRKVVRLSPPCTSHLYPPRKYSWYSFVLEAESTPGP
jgi:hypothetical protein